MGWISGTLSVKKMLMNIAKIKYMCMMCSSKKIEHIRRKIAKQGMLENNAQTNIDL